MAGAVRRIMLSWRKRRTLVGMFMPQMRWQRETSIFLGIVPTTANTQRNQFFPQLPFARSSDVVVWGVTPQHTATIVARWAARWNARNIKCNKLCEQFTFTPLRAFNDEAHSPPVSTRRNPHFLHILSGNSHTKNRQSSVKCLWLLIIPTTGSHLSFVWCAFAIARLEKALLLPRRIRRNWQIMIFLPFANQRRHGKRTPFSIIKISTTTMMAIRFPRFTTILFDSFENRKLFDGKVARNARHRIGSLRPRTYFQQ